MLSELELEGRRMLLYRSFHYEMLLSTFRRCVNTIPYRFLSQVRTLPYEIDRFNAVRVVSQDWPDDTKIVREELSSNYSIH